MLVVLREVSLDGVLGLHEILVDAHQALVGIDEIGVPLSQAVAVFSAGDRKLAHVIPMELTAKEKETRLIQFDDSPVPIGIVVTPDGKRAFVANTTADIITVLDLEAWKVVDRFTAGKEPDGMAVAKIPG